MKLGDVKAEALKLMFVNLDQDIDGENLSVFAYDETCNSYLVSMRGSIRRGLKVVANKHKLGTKTSELTEGAQGKFLTKYDLPADVLHLARVIRKTGDSFRSVYDWRIECGKIVLPTLHREDDGYRIVYYPKAPDLSHLEDTEELEIPEEVAEMLPYYIKGELFEEDDPGAAAQARNLFDQWLSEQIDPEEVNAVVESVYGWQS